MTLVIQSNGKTKKKYNFTGKNIVDRVEMMKPDTDIIYGKSNEKVTILENIDDKHLTTKPESDDCYQRNDSNQEQFIDAYKRLLRHSDIPPKYFTSFFIDPIEVLFLPSISILYYTSEILNN